jgi:glycosyltransferase involved in cell wall biosynthesis
MNTTPLTAVCTIVSRNYLHYARTLMQSLARAHPDWERYVLLVDELPDGYQPASECFRLVELSRLSLPHRREFLYRYNTLEANTAVKPWLLHWLFRRTGARRVLYLDPDIHVYRPLRELVAALDGGPLMVLTPHLTGHLDDDAKPTEHDILMAGCYNLGCIALQQHPALEGFLRWWQEKLEYNCRVDFAANLFVDQRWVDLAPGLFPDVVVLRNPAYNVAYWNIATRPVVEKDGVCRVGDTPLAFFHFSGLNPLAPHALSKHQDRFRLDDLGPVKQLVNDYCRLLHQNGLEQCRRQPYAFGFLRDGTPVADCMRSYYRDNPEAQARAGADPFAHDHEYLNEPVTEDVGVPVTKLMKHVWDHDADLRKTFPDLFGSSRLAYAHWFVKVQARTSGIPERFVAPVRQAVGRAWALGSGSLWDALFGPAVRPLLRVYIKLRPENQRANEQTTRKRGPVRTVARWLLPQATRAWLRLQLMICRAELLNDFPMPDFGPIEAPRPADKAPAIRLADEPDSDDAPATLPVRPRPAAGDGGEGINIVGYIRSEHGIGESARLCARAATAVRLPFSVHDFNTNNNSRTTDDSWDHKLADRNEHWVNVIHVNADQLPAVPTTLGDEFLRGHYNIGFWHWELPEFPDDWLGAFDLVDEVWVPSLFVLESIGAKARRPVVRLPHCVQFDVDTTRTRADFGLPESKFLFLTMFDTHSVRARKNPEAVVEAFRRAFPTRGDAHLVVKINNPGSYPADVEAVRTRLREMPNVTVLERIFTRPDVYALESLCDCFVSLHRSEGFGLGPAESMYLGKPVIATNWSGNRDFMNGDNSCPVDYRLIAIEKDLGPYRKGQVWADADVEHAAWYMKRLVAEDAWRKALGARARQTITTQLSPEAVGRRYLDRLATIRRLHGTVVELKVVA